VTMIIDADQHLYERPNLWREYCDPGKRDLAVAIEPDEQGYWRLTIPALGRRMGVCSISVPGNGFAAHGDTQRRLREGLPSVVDYARDLPEDYWNPSARVAKLDEWKIDKALTFFNFGMGWPRGVPKSRIDIFRTNMEAWNRWAADVAAESKGRLLPVGQVTLRGGDPTWLEQQLAFLASRGVKAATFTYGLIDGRRPSHPDHDRAWAAFVENGIVPVLHTQDSDEHASGFPGEWFEHDSGAFAVVDMVFCNVGVQITLVDMIFNGVFARFPELKVLCVENTASWIPSLIGASASGASGPGAGSGATATMAGGAVNPSGLTLDAAYRVREAAAGGPLVKLDMPASEYLRRHVRAAITAAEPVREYFAMGMGEMIMMGGDYPHAEGLASPRTEFEAAIGPLPDDQYARFYGGNAAELLGVA
jgi:predicted TIM-barrel fold metal-dependent hydrolase